MCKAQHNINDLDHEGFYFRRLVHQLHMMQAPWFKCGIGMNSMERVVVEQNQFLALLNEVYGGPNLDSV